MIPDKKSFKLIFKAINKKTRIKFILFFLLVLFVAYIEFLTIEESGIFATKILGGGVNEINSSNSGVNHSIIFLFLIIIANIGRALIVFSSLRLAYSSASQVSQKVYKNYLNLNYLDYLNRNSSEVISILSTKIGIMTTCLILPLISITSSIFMAVFIAISVFTIAPIYSIFSIIVVFFGYFVFSIITVNSLKRNSRIISKNSSKNIKIVQESVNSFREIKLSNLEKTFFRIFSKNESNLRISETNIRIISDTPRFLIETLIFSIIIILTFIFSSKSNGNNQLIISSLGSFLYGSQRLLPLMQLTFRSFSTIRSSTFSMNDIVEYLELKSNITQNDNKLNFSEKINLNSIKFKYPKSNNYVINNINLTINKGDIVCIVGNSGSGKSTLMDVMMGLIPPRSGSITIDQTILSKKNIHEWRANIAHVPQEILLIDDTIKNNIAFGIPEEEIDISKVNFALKLSSLDKEVYKLDNGLNTFVGERGSLLSGGQKQRIGIARAIYQNKEIIFLDEATSALDKRTEAEILKNITEKINNITVIMITHRPGNDINYDKIIEVKENSIFLHNKESKI